MKIHVLGGGPAGLYSAILLKQAWPEWEVDVFERNQPDDTFGFGVVFSDETLDAFQRADPETYRTIAASFRYWQEIATYYRGTCTVSTGHGFAALSRQRLLDILQERAAGLGARLHFGRELNDLEPCRAGADLLIAADGVNSLARRTWGSSFRPRLDWRRCKFTWLGTTKPLEAFTFIFLETEHGVFQVHAYPFAEGLATWIVECHEDVWRAAGLDTASEAETVVFCEALCADHLDGHPLLANRSLWRTFPTVQCETWCHDNVVLIGDAAHTAHFSVGSGTKLAMEDAIALVDAFHTQGGGDVRAAIAAYEDDRWVDVVKLQKAAQTSLEWFEVSQRYMGQSPLQLTVNLMTRSKRITYDNLAERDPELVRRLAAEHALGAGPEAAVDPQNPPPPIFTPFRLRGLELANRIVVSPMCQYSATDGRPDDWHLIHLGTRALGGAGLVITEMTDVSAEGRITTGCTGMYTSQHRDDWRRIVGFVHGHTSAKIGLQLAHAGRKGSCRHPWQGDDEPLGAGEGAWETVGPSALPFRPHWPTPRAMQRADLDAVLADFVRAARWAEEAGFDLVELHMAHGYLLSSFLSPLSNQRTDEYGGSLANRMRYPVEVFRAVRAAWPEAKPMSVRVTATDWMPDESGTTPAETVALARELKAAGCDVIDVSSGGNSPDSEPLYGRMYQVPFAEQVRYEAGIPVMAVGAIQGWDHANTVIAAGRADLAAMARPHLHDPYLTLHAAEAYEQWDQPWPGQYLLARPRPDPERGRRPVRRLSTPGHAGRVVEEWETRTPESS